MEPIYGLAPGAQQIDTGVLSAGLWLFLIGVRKSEGQTKTYTLPINDRICWMSQSFFDNLSQLNLHRFDIVIKSDAIDYSSDATRVAHAAIYEDTFQLLIWLQFQKRGGGISIHSDTRLGARRGSHNERIRTLLSMAFCGRSI
jgi:hypothetical protein